MKRRLIGSLIFLGLTIGVSTSMAQVKFVDFIGKEVTFTSRSYPTRQIMVKKGTPLKVVVLESPSAGDNSNSFKVVQALNGTAGWVSFESVAFPGYYLRHYSWEIVCEDRSTTRQFSFKNDVSFLPVKPLSAAAPGQVAFSFQPNGTAGRYIKNESNNLYARDQGRTQPNMDLWIKDATFIVTEVKPPTPTPKPKGVSITFIEIDDEVVVNLNGANVFEYKQPLRHNQPNQVADLTAKMKPGSNTIEVIATNGPGQATLRGYITVDGVKAHEILHSTSNTKGVFYRKTFPPIAY